MEADKYLYKDVFKAHSPMLNNQCQTVKIDFPIYEQISLQSQGSKYFIPQRQNSNDYFINGDANTPEIREKTTSLPTQLQQQKSAFQFSDNSSLKSSQMLSSPKNAQTLYNLNSFTSISTQSSGNNSYPYNFSQQNKQQKYDAIIDNKVQRACSQSCKPTDLLEQNGLAMSNTFQKNMISQSQMNEKTCLQPQNSFNQTRNFNIPPTSNNILNSLQYKGYKRQATADNLIQPQDLRNPNNLGVYIPSYTQQENLNQTKHLDNFNLTKINNRAEFNQSSSQQKFLCQPNKVINFMSERLNNFQTQQNFYSQNTKTQFGSPILTHDFNPKANSDKKMTNQHEFVQSGFVNSEQVDNSINRDESQKKEYLKKMIENRQKELQQLKQQSLQLRQNSIDSYKEINKKIKETNKQQKINQNFQSSAKLNTYILGRINVQGEYQQQQDQKSLLKNESNFPS
ncbi:hypothetical protein TTHERM_00024310 (macronuclear) [Tetrahymena thermophila SB210]|uniref:Uncharacterized protein n=1 Tax=Tetrahymena thermophila (strain SB210) TaxID=312017 RepID=Q22R50_TETTS|nr:hypothetical protein TTHERM_00024310 [Tetrahymena thermophila SB210]EAR88272.2 hypothetical protein TTHERM_00024310 [Tetrahymena thermophila SB210]|eukprot:XP_001008517.2 hypothetical protein TTHERM_00024310 [Tetrahymena thermophila SB210]